MVDLRLDLRALAAVTLLLPACSDAVTGGGGGAGATSTVTSGTTTSTSSSGTTLTTSTTTSATSSSSSSSASSASSASSSGGACDPPCVPANDCQTSTCAGGQCQVGALPSGTKIAAQVAGDCQSRQCDGAGNVITVVDATDPLDDGKACTSDVCQGTTPKSVPVAPGTACSQNGGKKCNAAGDCVGCLSDADCPGMVCHPSAFTCVIADCMDGQKNGPETDIDCGGPTCAKCPDGKGCKLGSDCSGGLCTASLKCCTPAPLGTTCAGKCGPVTDNCGQAVDCGGCAAPMTCGGGGVPGQCGSPAVGIWSKSFSGTNQVTANGASLDASGNAVLAGAFYAGANFGGAALTSAGANDAYLAKIDVNGNHVWSRRYGGSGNDAFNGVAVDGNGNVIACGGFSGASDYGMGTLTAMGTDAVIAKYDAAGSAVWTKSFGDAATQQASTIAADAAGNVVVGGHFASVLSFGGAAVLSSGSGNQYNGFIAKLSPAGAEIWSRSLGTPATIEIVSSLTLDGNGNVLALGYYGGTTNVGGPDLPTVPAGATGIFVVKLDVNGNHVWSRGIVPSATFAFPGSVAVDASGGVYATAGMGGDVDAGGGTRHCSNAGSTGALVVKYDISGNHVWSKCFSGTGNSAARGVAASANGHVFVTGGFSGTVDFGGGAVTAASTMERSFFLLDLTSQGAYSASKIAHSGEGYLAGLYGAGAPFVSGSFNAKIDIGSGLLVSTGIINVFLGRVTVP